jgi:dUTP pyrophosphatase
MDPEIDIPVTAADPSCLPFYATEGAAGADARAWLRESIEIAPGESAAIPTGLAFEIPEGYEMQIRPRSGLALKHAVTVLNTPGTVDSDYRGEVKVILINHGRRPFLVEPGMRIAQLVIAPVQRAQYRLSSELTATGRGAGGFGHSGLV